MPRKATLQDLFDQLVGLKSDVASLTSRVSAIEGDSPAGARDLGEVTHLEAEILEVLGRGDRTTLELASDVGATVSQTFTALQKLKEQELAHLTYGDRPRWRAESLDQPVGLRRRIAALLAENPLHQGELETLTGASTTRVSGTLNELVRRCGPCWKIRRRPGQGGLVYVPPEESECPECGSKDIIEHAIRIPTAASQVRRVPHFIPTEPQQKRDDAKNGREREGRSRSRRSHRPRSS